MAQITLNADLHLHTLASPCAYSTLAEMVRAAADRGLKAVAITDHGPGLQGGLDRLQFNYPTVLPKEYLGVRLYHGVEANILDPDGDLDLHGAELAALDLVIAGIHPGTPYAGATTSDHTRATVEAMANPAVRIISHPHNMHFPVDMAEVVAAAAATGTWLELNPRYMGSLKQPETLAQSRKMLTLAAESGVRVCVDSDSHFLATVGQFTEAIAVLEDVGFPAELLVNGGLIDLDKAIRTPKSRPKPDIEERLAFLIEAGQLCPDHVPVIISGLELIAGGIGKDLAGENAVMFATHIASFIDRLGGGEGEPALELDPIIKAEIAAQPPSLSRLVDRFVAHIDEGCGVCIPQVERLLLVAHIAALAGE